MGTLARNDLMSITFFLCLLCGYGKEQWVLRAVEEDKITVKQIVYCNDEFLWYF